MLEHVKAFFHRHPVESALLAGVAVIALYYALKPSAASSGQSQEAQLQADYFQAEGIQAQSNAAVQIAGITTSAQTSQTQINDTAAQNIATTYANENTAVNASNNALSAAALPYAEQATLIQGLTSVAGQTTTTQKSSSGFLGIGAGSKTTVAPTQAALDASHYLGELVNGSFAMNG
jgi:hypothetical protein